MATLFKKKWGHHIYYVPLTYDTISSEKKAKKTWWRLHEGDKNFRSRDLYWDLYGELEYKEEPLQETTARFTEIIERHLKTVEELSAVTKRNKDKSISQRHLIKIDKHKKLAEYYRERLKELFPNSIRYIIED
jgi:hypothetical protein